MHLGELVISLAAYLPNVLAVLEFSAPRSDLEKVEKWHWQDSLVVAGPISISLEPVPWPLNQASRCPVYDGGNDHILETCKSVSMLTKSAKHGYTVFYELFVQCR